MSRKGVSLLKLMLKGDRYAVLQIPMKVTYSFKINVALLILGFTKYSSIYKIRANYLSKHSAVEQFTRRDQRERSATN